MVFSGVISFERPYEKSGAPSCGIYLIAPEIIHPKLFAEQLRPVFAALNASPYQRHMHALEMCFPEAIYDKEREAAQTITALCKRNGIVPIVRQNMGLYIECGAEGILLEKPSDVAEARRILGDQAIIGIDCTDKKTAEAAHAAGIDYIKLNASLPLIEWWSTLTHLPAAVAASTENPNAVIEQVKSGAGFLVVGDWVWDHTEGPGRAIGWLQEFIEHGLTKVRVN